MEGERSEEGNANGSPAAAEKAAISKDSTSSKPEIGSKHLIRGVAKFIVVKRSHQQIVASYWKLANQVIDFGSKWRPGHKALLSCSTICNSVAISMSKL